jgi:hypothetical protein
MITTFTYGTIEWFVDHSRRVLFSRWEGDFAGADLMAALPGIWAPHPEAGRYAGVHDQLDFIGIIEHRYARETMRLRNERFGEDEPGIRTAVVTADPMKIFDLKVTSVEAPAGRTFRMFGSNAAALAWVTADEPGNPSAATRLPNSEGALPWWYCRSATARVGSER